MVVIAFYHITVVQCSKIVQNIEFFMRFSKNDHRDIVHFCIAFTFMKGQTTP